MRKTLPIILAAAAVLALSACTSGATPTGGSAAIDGSGSDSCVSPASGSVSDSVKVAGDFSQTPKVTIKTPLKAKSIERTVTIKGDGAVAATGETIQLAVSVYSGSTGKEVNSSGFDGTAPVPLVVGSNGFVPGLLAAAECLPVGSRAVSTEPVPEAWGGADYASQGWKKTDSMVFVVDVLDAFPTRASGTPVTPKAGFPKVKLSASGQPSVTIPKTDPPSTTQVEVLKKGGGTTVKSGDTVKVQFQGLVWRTGKVFQQTWGAEGLGPISFQTTGIVKGLSDALVGQTVGSQVVAVIPPADGYGSAGQPAAGIKGTDTIVFVVDILKIAS